MTGRPEMHRGDPGSAVQLRILETERFCEVGRPFRHEAMAGEPIHRTTNKDSQEADPANYVEEMYPGLVGMQDRHREPVEIKPVHHEQPDAHETENGDRALGRSRQQHEEGYDEMCDEQDGAVNLPTMLQPVPVPDRLLRNVAVPDQHVLTEGDVCPEDDESKRHLAEVLQMLARYDIAQIVHAEERHRDERYRGMYRHE